MYECEVRDADDLRDPRGKLRERIDTLEDQVRIYPTTAVTLNERTVIDARPVEERSDCWIVR